MPPEAEVGRVGTFLHMGRIARAHDTSICENPSNGSKPAATDSWHRMCATLAGEPVEPLPAPQGRKCRPLDRDDDDRDPVREQWDHDCSRTGVGGCEVEKPFNGDRADPAPVRHPDHFTKG